MDANGTRFWLLADDEVHWQRTGTPPALDYDGERRALHLARQRSDADFTEDASRAQALREQVPQARDGHGNRAWYAPVPNQIMADAPPGPPGSIYALERGSLTDLALGEDGVLYLAIDGMLVMHDMRARWSDVSVDAADFDAWRVAPVPGGGAWVLDRGRGRIARLEGYPLSDRAERARAAGVARPCRENENPPRLRVLDGAAWPTGESPVALACSLRGTLAVLSWRSGAACRVRQLLDDESALSAPFVLEGSRTPYTLAWAGNDTVAVLLTGTARDDPARRVDEARVYRVHGAAGSRWPVGDLYPLKADFVPGPFLHGLDYPPHYPGVSGSHALNRISFPFFTRRGVAGNANRDRSAMDSGQDDTVWHRVYVEAVIPRGCGIRVWLAAVNERLAHDAIAESGWHEHRFGERYRAGAPGDVPVAAWQAHASEIAHHPGLLSCPRVRDRAGLFSVLVQRPGRRVRDLSGRYLHVKVELTGPGNTTPELFALRAYASRFSYVERYLPRLYWESTYAPEADAQGTATPADFLGRFIGNFEGVMTDLEDRIAYSDLVTQARSAPSQALEWLAQWVGFEFEAGWSDATRREFLDRALELYRWHGTLRGLNVSLEIATQGGVSGGEIVVVEDYRLRRTFATILGANLDDEDDPLTLGGLETGNSFVGDTLFIGEEQREEFLALFAADLGLDTSEQAAVDAFFERLANRVTILVHHSVSPQPLGTIRRIAEREVPAHVEFRVLTTTAPLLAGITALVGVDTYLSVRPEPLPARVDRSEVGRGDYVMGPAVLDARVAGRGSGRPALPGALPVARADDARAGFGEPVNLDARRSTAAPGRMLTGYRWGSVNKETPNDDN